jgi:Contractile injection system tube protein/LysM domain
MLESAKLAKAQLLELKLDDQLDTVINPEKAATVQFNPETLKVSFANQIQTPSGTGDQSGTPARQFVGEGTTKLALQLWFDVTALEDGENTINDVRKLTQKVAYFITPKKEGKKFVPPAVRFLWGSFQFDGLMDSLEESLEFFSNDGRPLRASMSLALSRQKIRAFKIIEPRRPPPPAASTLADPGAPAGTKPHTPAPAGATVQSLADQEGLGSNWQAIAAANNIENPRLLAPGQLIDLDVPLARSPLSVR